MEHRQTVLAKDIKVDDWVDLKSCPYLKDKPVADHLWGIVEQVEIETADCVAICYESIDCVGYPLDTPLTIMTRTNKVERRRCMSLVRAELRRQCHSYLRLGSHIEDYTVVVTVYGLGDILDIERRKILAEGNREGFKVIIHRK